MNEPGRHQLRAPGVCVVSFGLFQKVQGVNGNSEAVGEVTAKEQSASPGPSTRFDSTTAVCFEGVSKRFRKGFRYHSLREEIALFVRALGDPGQPRHAPDEFHALRCVSFSVVAGEMLGVIGSNGAGKSTTLKLIARVTYPDEGRIRTRGRVAALLEAGAGLHPELSGRDNVFLSGAILGMSRAEIERQYDSIVAFSELAEFMSMPVKRFSTGMFVRLGFSVAVHTDPDILLVDEVLSVGDMGFQAKSLDRMLAFREQGVTIVFVSHYLPAIAQMCDRVLWLEHGETRMLGETAPVLEAYQEFQDRKIQTAQKAEEIQGWDVGVGDVVIERITTHREDGTPSDHFGYKDLLLLRIHYKAFTRVERPYFVVEVRHSAGALFTASMFFDDNRPEHVDGSGVVELLFRELPLLPGVYQVVGYIGRDATVAHFRPRVLASFSVSSPLSVYGAVGRIGFGDARAMAPIVVPYEWRIP